jgi:F-type H+-transporting ATPase subunit b
MENETESVFDEAVSAGEAADAAGAHGGEAAVGMPQLDPTIFPNLIFWLVVSLVVLYLILTRVALPRIGTVLTERHDAIANDLEQAALFKRRASEAEAAYDAALAKARGEAQTIAADMKAQINKELAALMAKADAEIAAKSAESEKRIREIEASAAESVSEVARSVTAEIAAAFAPSAPDASAVEAALSARLGG